MRPRNYNKGTILLLRNKSVIFLFFCPCNFPLEQTHTHTHELKREMTQQLLYSARALASACPCAWLRNRELRLTWQDRLMLHAKAYINRQIEPHEWKKQVSLHGKINMYCLFNSFFSTLCYSENSLPAPSSGLQTLTCLSFCLSVCLRPRRL